MQLTRRRTDASVVLSSSLPAGRWSLCDTPLGLHGGTRRRRPHGHLTSSLQALEIQFAAKT